MVVIHTHKHTHSHMYIYTPYIHATYCRLHRTPPLPGSCMGTRTACLSRDSVNPVAQRLFTRSSAQFFPQIIAALNFTAAVTLAVMLKLN